MVRNLCLETICWLVLVLLGHNGTTTSTTSAASPWTGDSSFLYCDGPQFDIFKSVILHEAYGDKSSSCSPELHINQYDRTCFTDFYIDQPDYFSLENFWADEFVAIQATVNGTVDRETGVEAWTQSKTLFTTPDVLSQTLTPNSNVSGRDTSQVALVPIFGPGHPNPPPKHIFDDGTVLDLSLDVVSHFSLEEGDNNNNNNNNNNNTGHSLSCVMRVNDQTCTSCQVIPCHAFAGPSYKINCSNLVRNADSINTCLQTGMTDNLFRYWNLWNEGSRGYLMSCNDRFMASSSSGGGGGARSVTMVSILQALLGTVWGFSFLSHRSGEPKKVRLR